MGERPHLASTRKKEASIRFVRVGFTAVNESASAMGSHGSVDRCDNSRKHKG